MEEILSVYGNSLTLSITGETEQYNAVHHYENNGVQVDIDPFSGPGVSLTPITYRDRLETRNDALKEIVVIRPDQITTIVSEFQRFVKQ